MLNWQFIRDKGYNKKYKQKGTFRLCIGRIWAEPGRGSADFSPQRRCSAETFRTSVTMVASGRFYGVNALWGSARMHPFASKKAVFRRSPKWNGERARLGRSFPRPRGKPGRTEMNRTFVIVALARCWPRGAASYTRGGCAPQTSEFGFSRNAAISTGLRCFESVFLTHGMVSGSGTRSERVSTVCKWPLLRTEVRAPGLRPNAPDQSGSA